MDNLSEMPQKLKIRVTELINLETTPEKHDFFNKVLSSISDNYYSSAEEILSDLTKLHEMHCKQRRIDGLFHVRNEPDKQLIVVKFFLHELDNFFLSDILKIIEGFRIRILDHLSYKIVIDESLIVHEFIIDNSNLIVQCEKLDRISENFFQTFENVLSGKWTSSAFNKLSLLSCVKFDDIRLLTVVEKYLRHISRRFDQELLESLTEKNSEIFNKFIELFHLRLEPGIKIAKRADVIRARKEAIQDFLSNIENVNEARLLKDFYELILAIVRTNFYQKKGAISIKVKPKMIPFMSGIQPYATIFVFSADYEAVHLRGSKVSRGGLRWSDRRDFPTEVLGLMRAQMKKNTIIIPSGAKGGFYISDAEKNKDRNFVIACYKEFLCSILDITDNLDEHNNIIRPQNVEIPCDLEKDSLGDESYDPYVVVAADKGTGAFSNYANEISAKYNFWLGDAFASGGSNGYDHKALAITSRGAFISVQKLFNELGKDIDEKEFTVVGIGDMIGDVFGNGMLLSRKIKLVAAFNHMNIFIDPNPDAEISFIERQRIFRLSSSTWNDYDKSLISSGGGVFSRNQKEIVITQEISRLFDIPASQMTLNPDELVKYILKAKIDLLWNGGIGTFVKSDSESHEDVSDKSNDNIRVNGGELRFKVVAEGGNLGFTQLGRVDAARAGVKINADFIDNSGGVGCSDREVNIKITLSKALKSGKINLEERNKLLVAMQHEVCELVLKDNVLQNNALMLEESYKFFGFDKHVNLIIQLERLKILNRASECIPNDYQIEKMRSLKQSFSRPEIAILLTYTKVWLKDEILKSDLPDNTYFDKFLIGYFPEQMQQKFKSEILSHPLRREIITNYVTNTLINRVGINFISSIMSKTGKKVHEIIYAYITVRDSYKLREIWHEIEYKGDHNNIDCRIKALLRIRHFAEDTVCWYLQHQSATQVHALTENIKNSIEGINYLKSSFDTINTKKNLTEYRQEVAVLTKQGMKKDIAEEFAKINFLIFAPSLIVFAKSINFDLKSLAKLYFLVEERLELRQVVKNICSWHTYNVMQESALTILLNNIATEHLRIVEQIITSFSNVNSNPKFSEQQMFDSWWNQKFHQIESYKEIAMKIYFNGELDYSILILLVSRMYLL